MAKDRKELTQEQYDKYSSVNIEFYIASEDIVVYPIGMFPGCDIFKQFRGVGRLCRLNEFWTSALAKEIMDYAFSFTELNTNDSGDSVKNSDSGEVVA